MLQYPQLMNMNRGLHSSKRSQDIAISIGGKPDEETVEANVQFDLIFAVPGF